MPTTIADVAARAGVSTATVSRVLSGSVPARPETRERVLAAVRELGYRPSGVARSLKLRRTHTIGLIVTDIENPYFPEIVRAVEDAARELDYTLVLCNGADDREREAAYLEVLAERRIDGIIIATGGLSERHARWLARAPVPVVIVNSEPITDGIAAVLSDNRTGGRIAAEHLLDLGHRAIGHITVPRTHAAAEPRLAGVRDALRTRGIAVGGLAVVEGDGHVAGGQRAMDELLARRPDATAVACYNDLTAIGAIRSLRAHGRSVPRDVSVVGFDDLDLASYVDPPLTTIVQQKREMGRWAVERLVRSVGGNSMGTGDSAEVVRLPVHLVVRESTAPLS
jgi:DNA-binding LacI/PurR family transcriptional regulator